MNIKDFEAIKLDGLDAHGIEREFSLAEFTGTELVLYFYPKDNTLGCTKEACDFRDNMNRIVSKALLVGVSPDTIKSHKKFREAHNLNFILLSDPDHELSEKIGVWGEKSLYGKKYMGITRSTFVFDENGELVKSWSKVKVLGHAQKVLDFLTGK